MTYKCPSCGAPYNGKRCRKCLYENFTEEFAHGSHTHKGEPLVIDAPVRRPIPQQDPFGCPPEAPQKRSASRRKATKKFRNAIVFLILVSAVPTILSGIVSLAAGIVTSAAEGIRSSSVESLRWEASAEPEEILDGTVLYADEDYSIVADLGDGQPLGPEDAILIRVENNAQEDVIVASQNVIANGWLLKEAFFYCDTGKESAAVGELTFDANELALCGIDSIETLSLQLQIYSDEDYDTFLTTGPITLLGEQEASPLLDSQAAVGTPLYEGDSVSVSLLGYQAASYAPDTVSDGMLYFYLENRSDSVLSVYTEECSVNGKDIQLTLYAELPAQTRAVAGMYLFDLESSEIGIESLTDIASFRVSFTVYDDSSGEDFTTDMLDIGTILAIE